jgi:autotransporter-associated beta strand protein
MKSLRMSFFVLLTILLPRLGLCALVGPYTPDANTIVLLHLDEASGGSVTTNVGSLGGNFISVNYSSDSLPLTVETTMLGATSYSTNSPTTITFDNCEYNTTSGYLLGYDYNRDGVFEGDNGSGTSVDFIGMTNLNIGKGGQSPFTLEAIIKPTVLSGNQEIICTDSQDTRAFQFRLNGTTLQFQFITGSQALAANIPTTGPNAFVANAWFHVAFTYNGTVGTLYWTRLDPSIGAANPIGSGNLTMGTSDGAVTGPLCIGNRGRPTGTETFLGGIDEVRISSVARAANQMQFYSPLVTITQNPINQNVDYNQPVSFTVGASSLTSLGYQWEFNSSGIAGATNSAYTIPNVAAANAGSYACVVTNTSGNSATSSPAILVVGAANFLAHRYSFTNGTIDSIGGANGTLFGDAVVTNGMLVLDGTTNTYMGLPSYIVDAATNGPALTVEFWASYGANSDNCYVFSFGNTNSTAGIGGEEYVIYSPHNGVGQEIQITPSDSEFAQTVTNPVVLDGGTWHIACVIDPPDQILAIYTNGALAAINTNLTIGLANVNDAFSYIGRSLFPADPYLNANIEELRMFNGALSGLTIKQSDIQGPRVVLANGPAAFVLEPANTAVPPGWPVTFSAAAVGYLPITYQWAKNGTAIPGATNASYTFTPTPADNNDTFVCYATNTIGVTTYGTNSATATLSVFTPATLAWLGTADGGQDSTWNTSSLDWTNATGGGGIVAFAQTNGVLFDDRSGGGSVDLEQTIIPYNITVNASSSYYFTSSSQLGALAGLASLTKSGSGLLNLDLTNNLNGPVTISGGELQIGQGDAYGSLGSGPVTNNANLSLNRGDAVLNVANAIHGAGTLSVDGPGAVTISGANDYTGPTLLNSGIVYLTSSNGLGSTVNGTTVASGAQLYITANVNVAEGLTLNSAGDGNGALRKGGAGTTIYTGPIGLATASTIGVDSGATLILSNVVSGAQALTANGGGTLVLDYNNSFSGGFTLDGAVVEVNTAGALGSGPVTVSGAGRFVLATGLTFTNAVTASTVSAAAYEGLLMVNDNTNDIVTTVSGPLEFDASPASGGNFVGPISSGYLNVTGPITNTATGIISVRLGRVQFSGGGDYTTFDADAGTTVLGANNGLCTNAALAVGLSGAATFDMNGFNQALTGLSDGGANAELVTNSGSTRSTLTLNLSSASSYANVIAGNIALVENGTALLYLGGTNAYTGNTTVNGGTLELAQPTLAAVSTVSVASGALLQLDFSTTNTVSGLVLGGMSQPRGVYNSSTSSSFIAGTGSLLVSPVSPIPTNLLFSVSGNTLNLSWPADHLGWILLTNSVNPAIASDWFAFPGSGSVTNVVITINPQASQVFYRLLYP